MTTEPCASMEFMLQADVDGQLSAGDSAQLALHLMQCAACRKKHHALAALSVRLRSELPYHAVPAQLRRRIRTASRKPAQHTAPNWRWLAFPAGLGAALAVAVGFALMPPGLDTMSQSVVASHIRALQPGHLMDVMSSDRHTVKPWFDGRLDYSPPVKDLAAQGYPLVGGRLDYLAGRPVAALDYRRAKHDIDLYVWPSASISSAFGEQNGYHFIRWSQNNMQFWAISDLNPTELNEFVSLWKAMK